MRNVSIYLFDEIEVLDFSGPFEVFSNASRMFRRGLNLVVVFAVVATSNAEPGAQTKSSEDSNSFVDLRTLERKLATAAKTAKPSVVRVSWINRRVQAEQSFSGVIITTNGYIASCAYNPSFELDDLSPGKPVRIHLGDGRTIDGVAVGSALEWGFGLFRITEEGQWPSAPIGNSAQTAIGQPCLTLGFPSPIPGVPHPLEPSLCFGQITVNADRRWLATTCLLDGSSGRGSGLFNLDGELIGIHATPDADLVSLHAAIEIVQRQRAELAARREAPMLSETREPASSNGRTNAANAATAPVEDPRVAAAVARAKKVTLRIENLGSGVLVSTNGYVVTHAHSPTPVPPGSPITLQFEDGRTVQGAFLGGDRLLDIGLAKITTPGTWPDAEWQSAGVVKAGDVCLTLGYPSHLQKGDRIHLTARPNLVVRTGRITDDQWFAPWELTSSCLTAGGDSGGGLFDAEGRLLGITKGGYRYGGPTWHRSSDLFKKHWQFLVHGGAYGKPVKFDQSRPAQMFRDEIKNSAPSVVEVLADGKRQCLGMLVSDDGYVLTKASELYGNISCRMSTGPVQPATVGAISTEHDLALLKINVSQGFSPVQWSQNEQIRVGSFVAVKRSGEAPTVGVVARPTHDVARVPGWFILGDVKDNKQGVEVVELRGIWQSQTPIRQGDVICEVEAHSIPNTAALEGITRHDGPVWEMPSVIAGDPIRVKVIRDGKMLNLRFPLLSPSSGDSDQLSGPTSMRRSAFPAVFETNAELTKDMCGAPVVDVAGHVIGIVIAKAKEHCAYVVPAGTVITFLRQHIRFDR